MKKAILTFLVIPVALFLLFNVIVIAIGQIGQPTMKEIIVKNIGIAQQKYPGTAEDALIAYLIDTANTCHDRSDIAVWTLGQIKSTKALPVMQQLYKDDPSGVTCAKRHDKVICQRILHKAIVAIESDRKLYSGLNR